MKKENDEKDIENYYNDIEIPKELSLAVKKGIEKGKNKKRKTHLNGGFKIACSFLLIITLGIAGKSLKLGNSEMKTDEVTGAMELPKIKNEEQLISLISRKGITINSDTANEVTKGSSNIESESSKRADYSETNNQVENVEEGDIVKTDGVYIYTARNRVNGNGVNDEFVIVKADEASSMKIEAKITVEGYARELYITKDKLIIIYQNSNEALGSTLDIYDKKDINNLKLERRLNYSGVVVNSRFIDGKIILVTNDSPYSIYPLMEDTEKGVIRDGEKIIYLPRYYDSLTEKENVVNLNDITCFPNISAESFITLYSINIENSSEEIKEETILSSVNNIYCSKDNLYVTSMEGDFLQNTTKIAVIKDSNTSIYKFSLKNGEIVPIAKGEVKGRVLNQFSMDENGGNFRIATTDGFSDDSKNNLYILDENLKEIGKLEGLAPKEKIYSVRFLDNTAYMVTFKQVDPLFVIDLSDKYNPKVTGELKIPGFSNYLHPLDSSTLIGFGEDRDEDGRDKGLKLSIFDVKDETAPKEKSTLSFGGIESYSEANYNHKAFFLNKEKSIIGIPMVNLTNYGRSTEGVIYLAKYSENGVLSKFGELKFDTAYRSGGNRIIYINNNIYVITNNAIESYNIDSLEPLGKIEY